MFTHTTSTKPVGDQSVPPWKENPFCDPVNHPNHYTGHPSGIECIEVTRHMTFNRGNAIKYIWRAGAKGDCITDLEKAIWYLQDEVHRLNSEAAG